MGASVRQARDGSILHAVIDDALSGDNEIVAAVAGFHIRVLSYTIVAAGAVTVRFESGPGGTALTGQMSLSANGGVVNGYHPGGCFDDTDEGDSLNLELGGAVSVDGHLSYMLVAA